MKIMRLDELVRVAIYFIELKRRQLRIDIGTQLIRCLFEVERQLRGCHVKFLIGHGEFVLLIMIDNR